MERKANRTAADPPVVGIVTRNDVSATWKDYRLVGQGYDYCYSVALAGGAPVLIPLELGPQGWRSIYGRLDGILFPGGVDVDPQHYGEAPHPCLGQVISELDEAELVLAQWALQDRLPTLGICRGIQLLNVAAGGTLYQDISAQLAGVLNHRCSPPEYPRGYRAHEVSIERGSRLHMVLGATRAQVNSHHHQAVKDVASGFRVTARSPDGVVEAIEMDGECFVVGVQWHPESMAADDEQMLSLFAAFVQASRQWALTRA